MAAVASGGYCLQLAKDGSSGSNPKCDVKSHSTWGDQWQNRGLEDLRLQGKGRFVVWFFTFLGTFIEGVVNVGW